MSALANLRGTVVPVPSTNTCITLWIIVVQINKPRKQTRLKICSHPNLTNWVALSELHLHHPPRYAKEGSGVYLGLCAMLLCRCAQGEVLTVSEARDTREATVVGGNSVGGCRGMIFFSLGWRKTNILGTS